MRLAARAAEPLSASALGRPARPRRHRARGRRRARTARARRADRGARRVGPGGDPQASPAAESRPRHELSVRVARSERGAAAMRPRARHVSGQDRGDGAGESGVRKPAPPLYAGAARAGPMLARRACRRCAGSVRSATSRAILPKQSRPDFDKATAQTGVEQMAATEDPFDAFIDAAAGALGLAIEPTWKPAVAVNLALAFRLAALVTEFDLPDEAEPAPV